MAGASRCCCGKGSCLCEVCAETPRKSCCLQITLNGLDSCGDIQVQHLWNPLTGDASTVCEGLIASALNDFPVNVRNGPTTGWGACFYHGRRRLPNTDMLALRSSLFPIAGQPICQDLPASIVYEPVAAYLNHLLILSSGHPFQWWRFEDCESSMGLNPYWEPDFCDSSGVYAHLISSVYGLAPMEIHGRWEYVVAPIFGPVLGMEKLWGSGTIDCSFSTPVTIDNRCTSDVIGISGILCPDGTNGCLDAAGGFAACGPQPWWVSFYYFGCTGGHSGNATVQGISCLSSSSGIYGGYISCECCPAIPINIHASDGHSETHILYMSSEAYWYDAYCTNCSGVPQMSVYLDVDDAGNDYTLGLMYRGVPSGYSEYVYTAPVYDGTTFLCPENAGPYSILSSGNMRGDTQNISLTFDFDPDCGCENLSCSGHCPPVYALAFEIPASGTFFACLTQTSGLCFWENENKTHFDVQLSCGENPDRVAAGCEGLAWHLRIIDNTLGGQYSDYFQEFGKTSHFWYNQGACPKSYNVLNSYAWDSNFLYASGTLINHPSVLRLYEQQGCDCPSDQSECYNMSDYRFSFTVADEVVPYSISLIKTSTGPETALCFWEGAEVNPRLSASGTTVVFAEMECISYSDAPSGLSDRLIYDKYWRLTVRDEERSCAYIYLSPILPNSQGYVPPIDYPTINEWFEASNTCPSGRELTFERITILDQCLSPTIDSNCAIPMGVAGTLTCPCDGKFKLALNVDGFFVPGATGSWTITLDPGGTVVLDPSTGYDTDAFSCYRYQEVTYTATGTIGVPSRGNFGPEGDTSGVWSDPPYNVSCPSAISGTPLFSLIATFTD